MSVTSPDVNPAYRQGHNPKEGLLHVEGLRKTFLIGGGPAWRKRDELYAVNGISFDIERGQTFGLVGESGCGKSTVARCVMRLVEPTSGRIIFDGTDLLELDSRALRRMRRRMQMVFQDTSGSLDSRMSVRSILEEPLVIHGIGSRTERRERVGEMLELVGLRSEIASRMPHELSGGQRQRIGVARALNPGPEFVVLDEPVSALDVSVQAQILNLLRDLQERLNLTYLFIVHDLTVAQSFCDRIAVLYLGQIMEVADRSTLFQEPQHPYTVSLLSAVPVPGRHRRKRARIVLRGEVSPLGGGAVRGCPFQPRCPVGRGRKVCVDENPALEQRQSRHLVACHFPGELSASGATTS